MPAAGSGGCPRRLIVPRSRDKNVFKRKILEDSEARETVKRSHAGMRKCAENRLAERARCWRVIAAPGTAAVHVLGQAGWLQTAQGQPRVWPPVPGAPAPAAGRPCCTCAVDFTGPKRLEL